MISVLLALTLGAFGLLAFTTVLRTATTAAAAQLRTVIAQTAESSNRSGAARLDFIKSIASDSIVARIASAGNDARSVAGDSARMAAMLQRRRLSNDSVTQVTQLVLRRDGGTQVLRGSTPSATDRAWLDVTARLAAERNEAQVSPLFRDGAEHHYWLLTPVQAGGERIGFYAESRRVIASPAVEQQVRALTGYAFSVFFTNAPGVDSREQSPLASATDTTPVWIDLSGRNVPAGFAVPTAGAEFRVTTADGQRLMGHQSPVRGTPWRMVFVVSEASVQKPAMAFLRQMIVVAVLLLLIGTIGAWLVSRRVTRPLMSLADGALTIARGDFTPRAHANGNEDNEFGVLAAAFNRMAVQTGHSYELLATRMRESEALAAELRTRNHLLQVAEQLATDARVASDASRAEAQRANAAKSDFLAMMSHELRTPLSAIAGYAEILQLGVRGDLNPAQRADLARIQANQTHLLHIINDMLDLTQVESGQLVMTLEPLPLPDVIASLEPIVRTLVDERQIEFRIHPAVLEACAIADHERLLQVLVNLVANAVRYTDTGGSVQIGARLSSAHVSIDVIDSGIGIPQDKQELVFEPFVQVDGGMARRTQGTGLGLAISRRFCEAMGGTLTLASEPGIGSTFTVTLARGVVAIPMSRAGTSA
ncbi:sensor histidine kinase [Gemmatimonas groenlandica]|nr:ATP-binding protein [Gemmatimonas groenlandica]